MSKKIVVALGGNAILTEDASAKAQQEAIHQTVEKLMPLIEAGNELIVTHGNGPQVGNLLLQQLENPSEKNPALPLDTLVAMTQGSIGYWLKQSLEEAFAKRNIEKQVAVVVTQTTVAGDDPAFRNPTKPIGPFYTEAEAKEEMMKTKASYQEDAGRGWRRVVPSPKPLTIKEYPVIQQLINDGILTIAAGGGGIPIIEENGISHGVEAVIDKDLASETLAELVDADQFIILTGVDNVYVHFNQPNQKKLERVSISELKQYIAEDQFPAGSMLPKIEAGIEFVTSREGRETIITSLDQLESIVHGAGTTIIR